jgi:Zn finger protein HypA/HybF involved in hydrogenase expression
MGIVQQVVEIGRLSAVLPDALRFCFDLLSRGKPLRSRDLL